MFTSQERVARALEVFRDAFDGQLCYLEGDEANPDLWHGEIHGTSKLKFSVLARQNDPILHLTVINSYGESVETHAGTYEEFAGWAYSLSRRYGLQDWITPRHFAHLVTRILCPSTPVMYTPMWPHQHEVRLSEDQILHFEWDEDECRIKASFNRGNPTFFHHAGDAIGWLTVLRDQIT